MDLPSPTVPAPRLTERLRPLLEAEFPVFSKPEMSRRRDALAAAMAEAGVRHVVLSGGDRKGSAIQWLTGWPPGGGHFVVFTPGEADSLYVKNPNNAALARIMAPEAVVGWSAEGSQTLMINELLRRGAKGQTVGVVGSYGHGLHEKMAAAGVRPVDFNRAYTRLRLMKSEEELEWVRVGCALTDLAVEALERELEPGLTEHQLADIIERAYVPWGGMTQIHYTGVTSMADPSCCVPSQLARNRTVHAGDVVFTEIAASFWSYPGQLQRTIAVAAEPTPLYRDLHAVAEETFAAILKVLRDGARPDDVLDAASRIARAGFTICDDLVHGYVGGYLPPVLGTRERPSGPVPDLTLRENMTVVVQPSVMTNDGKAGVQCGELVRITGDGVERLHHAPWGFRRVG
ncbi:MAG TPA: M24 family metallopeptidase [Alphaproteobacteria bacterium]|jgi:Xaa-Pro aminopeptidase|nr:M24 family metallopeptidase [Alphaproteobacteria bacterium]